MSEENVEKIRAWLKAWSRGDWDAALKDAAPDLVIDNSTTIGEWRGVHRGAEEINRMWGLLTEPWERVEIELGDVIESQNDRVVTSNRARFYGRDGIELPGPTRSGWIWDFRDGLLVRVTVFNDLRDALKAAGLSE
jgi:ketosteroid isomerase-like protein